MKTESQLLVEAITNLRPNSQFVITDNDYSTIEWHVLDGTAPTLAQINAEIVKIQAAEADAETVKAANAASAISKLEALGLTAEEIAAIKS
jgi:hypothetical protein